MKYDNFDFMLISFSDAFLPASVYRKAYIDINSISLWLEPLHGIILYYQGLMIDNSSV